MTTALGPRASLRVLARAWRAWAVVVAVTALWLVLAARLVQLHVLQRDDLLALADRQRSYDEAIRARPGDIVDRHGRLLATTITARSLFIDPQRVDEPWAFSRRLATAVDVDADHLFVRLSRHADKRFLWVKRRLSEAEAKAVESLDLPPGSFGFRDEYLRQYPQGRLAAHVLGLRDVDGVGRGGIEESCDELIRGRDGKRRLVRDARGRVLEVHEEITAAPVPGRTVVLSLDAVVQLYAERELDALVEQWAPRGAAAIVMDPQTGEILAMASRPTFDPDDPTDAPPAAWRNNAVASAYEPGSTFKPLIVASAIDGGLLQRDEVLDCEGGAYRMGRRLLHDHHPYGVLSVTDVLVKSSNIGMAKIGERLGNAGLCDVVHRWGFGRRTGVRLPGEVVGIVRPLARWDHYSTGSVPMGQEIAVTPLQLITAHTALAAGGRLVMPRLVLRDVDAVLSAADAQPPSVRPRVSSRVVSEDVARWIVAEPMRQVVERGTGRQGRIDGYSVFGKTGTAQKPDPQTGRISSDLHVASFVCGAPADEPRVIVLVVVDEPGTGSNHGGGTVAAPAASRLLHKTLIHLRVPPG